MKLVSAILARNEAAPDRYLARVIARCREFSDRVLVLDDHSTDATRAVAREAGATVLARRGVAWAWESGETSSEAPARAELWERAAEAVGDGWVLVCDADMLLVGDPRPLTLTWEHNAWAWPLVDLWDSESTFRVDGPWAAGPVTPRPWLFCPSRVPAGWTPSWASKRLHVGHAPVNFPLACGMADDLLWKHLAYVTKEHRVRKHAQYLQYRDQLTPFELVHASSILDPV